MVSKLKIPRCLDLFKNGLGSPKTYVSYKFQLDRFLAWTKIPDYDDLLKADDKSIQRLLSYNLENLKKNRRHWGNVYNPAAISEDTLPQLPHAISPVHASVIISFFLQNF